ncbi:IS110 family transposase [Streptomyces longispororuber]|uniref:IS110 family transposase n=1 Tax=Streptomyces longispororuber TaxID=68230 RepID=UPI00210C502A|nr:IS110 family transposase [Streptomyces longispororuber]MCQ4205601.1 IS110 family transposase [Streptomyces longispororuber]
MAVPELWAGMDAGKAEHHCVVIDTDGQRKLSRRVANDETTLLKLIDDVLALSDGEPVSWAIDLNAGGAALMIALLTDNERQVLYIPGRTVHHVSGSYRGDGKTDAKDAFVIADQARMRRDLQPMHRGDDIAVDLRILTARRLDLAADRTRVINRMRAQMLEYFPALERAFEYKTSKASLVLLTGYQTPAALRRIGKNRLAAWLKNRKVRNSQLVATIAVQAAEAQHTAVAGERLAAAVVAKLAREVTALDDEIAQTDALIEGRFHDHPHAEVILSMPGLGPVLGAEFIAHTGGDVSVFGSPDRLAGVAGLAPVPKDSGRISGNMRRPRRYCRRLMRVFYMSAQVAAQHCPASKAFYERKRAEKKTHKQAVIALARRRLNVLWALLRDGRLFESSPPPRAASLG